MAQDDGTKYVTVAQLANVLCVLPGDHRLVVNDVGNLTVLNERSEYVGYIDFMDGVYNRIGS
jgi:hypothetical protein